MKHIVMTASLLLLAAGSAQAQTAPPAAPAPAAAPQPTAVPGVTAAALSAWLATQNATAEAAQMDGDRRYMRVTTDGLSWLLFLQSCEGDVCSDLQFSAGVAHAQVTADKVNAWNRDRRFVKAVYEAPQAGGQPSAVAQFDVLVPAGGPEELTDQLAIWRSLLPEFVRLMTVVRPTAAPAAPGS